MRRGQDLDARQALQLEPQVPGELTDAGQHTFAADLLLESQWPA